MEAHLGATPARFYGMHHLLADVVRVVLIFAFFRYPQWGIRIHCEKLPDPQVNL